MEESYAPQPGRWLARAATCLLVTLALLASFCLPPASALGGWLSSAQAAEAGADGDEPETDPDEGAGGEQVGGAEVAAADRAKQATCPLPGAKITRSDKRYLYTSGQFTVVVAESAGGFSEAKVPSARCTGGKTSSFKCANYVKVTFGIALERAAKNPANEGETYAWSGKSKESKGQKIRSGASDDAAKLSSWLNDKAKAMVWIESQECVGDRAGDADAPALKFKVKANSATVYGKFGKKKVDYITSPIVMNMAASEDSLSVANEIELTYKNKAADQVFWQRGKDGGNTEGGNNKNGKLYSMHRYSFYVDNGSGSNSYEDYTGYNFIHGESGATACEERDCDLNVTINLGSTGVIGATHWVNSGTASNPSHKDGDADHYDRIVNPWACLKMSQPGEKVKVDLGGGSLESLGATEADNKLFTNYTLKGTVAENEAGAKKSDSYLTLANGSTITLGVPKKEGAKFLGWAWEKVDKNFDAAYSASGQNRTAYSDNTFAAAYAKKISSSLSDEGLAEASLKHLAKDLSKIEGEAANADGKGKTEIYGSKTATITVENGYQTLAKSKSNGANHNNGWVKCPKVTRACTMYRAVWSDEDPTLDNTHTLTYNVDGTDVKVVSGLKAGQSYTLESLSSLGAKDGWYKKASCTGTKYSDWKKSFPDKDVTVYGTAAKAAAANTVRYYVDGKLVQTCTVDFNDLGLNDTYSSSYDGPLNGRVSIADGNLVERSDGVAKWDVASATVTSPYKLHYETTKGCEHSSPCSHIDYWSCPCGSCDCDDWDEDGHKTSWCNCTYYPYYHSSTDWDHGGCGTQGQDSYYSSYHSKTYEKSWGAPSNPNGGTWHKWYTDPACNTSAASTYGESDIKKGINLYSYTEHKVTYVLNPGQDVEKSFTHMERYGFTEVPECDDSGVASNCGGKVTGWFLDKACTQPTSSKGYTVKEGGTLTYYGYTKHNIKYICNGETVASEWVKYGDKIDPYKKDGVAKSRYPVGNGPDGSKDGELVSWFIGSESGSKAGSSEKAKEGLTFYAYTRHNVYFIMDDGVESPAVTHCYTYGDLVPGGGDKGTGYIKYGQTVTLPTGSYVSGKVTNSGCEDWATHKVENGLAHNTWFAGPDCSNGDEVASITVEGPYSVYSYNVAYLTMDLTESARQFDKTETTADGKGGKYQLYRQKVSGTHADKQTPYYTSGTQVNLHEYIDEIVNSDIATDASANGKIFPASNGYRHLFRYGDTYDSPDLPNFYYLNQSPANSSRDNGKYQGGDEAKMKSRAGRDYEGFYVGVSNPTKADSRESSITVTKNETVYKAYWEGIYEGVITM